MINEYLRMDYAEARAKLRHARTDKPLETKWVANNTFLRSNEIGGQSVVELIFIGAESQGEKRTEHHPRHRIILWAKDHFTLDFCNHKTVTTYDRFNRFMPRGFRAWGFRETKRTSSNGNAFLDTPKGTRLFNDRLKLAYTGEVLEPAYLNQFDGRITAEKLHRYAINYSKKFCGLRVSKEPCHHCLIAHRTDAFFSHLMEHVEKSTMPSSVLQLAAERLSSMQLRSLEMTSSFLEAILEVGWKENELLRHKPREEEALLDYVVKVFRGEIKPSKIKPSYYRKNIRTIVEDFLLDTFGYER
jgi:hypothetical protein